LNLKGLDFADLLYDLYYYILVNMIVKLI